jgi:hypothetical protein
MATFDGSTIPSPESLSTSLRTADRPVRYSFTASCGPVEGTMFMQTTANPASSSSVMGHSSPSPPRRKPSQE